MNASRMSCILRYILINFHLVLSSATQVYEIDENLFLTTIFVSKKDAIPLEIMLDEIDISFHVCLYEDKSVFSSATKVYIFRGSKMKKLYIRNLPDATLYIGYLKESKANAIGYLYENHFVGRYQTSLKTHFSEPANFHQQFKGANDTIFYDLKQVIYNSKYKDGKGFCDEIKHKPKIKKYFTQNDEDPCNKSFSFKVRQERSCSLEILVDHTYFEYMEFNVNRTVAEVQFYTMFAQYVFLNSDIDQDGKPDGIGFNIDKITIFGSNNEPGYLLNTETNNEMEFLEHISQYRHTSCMLICFTRRDFWKDSGCSSGRVSKIGGICSEDDDDTLIRSNVGFITNLERNFTIPRFKVAANFVHLLGHAFGCKHDPIDLKECNPGESKEYIMHEDVPFQSENNWRFSNCCLKSIQETIKLKAKCLKRIKLSSCGNGIIEEGEACDCDHTTDNCTQHEQCCIPKSSPNHCTVKHERNIDCPFQSAECCNKSCKFSQVTEGKPCYSNVTCFNATTVCDGTSPFCPGILEADGTPCLGTSRTCQKGYCVSNVCELYELQPCECLSLEEECHICCKTETSTCKTAKEFKIFPSENQLYIKNIGTRCNKGYGTCVSNGICKIEKQNYLIWYIIFALPYLLFTAWAIFFTRQQK
ncbi:disintegrin and metalloproteinase domain-containing protein 10-like [Centruroides vittatus]|uniref:disintegrin and metalloproteinase domain-containing protein 10-like n=1 Tax=Centruroides vittatus TaxID=120091 RepID=UPI00350FF613